MPVKNIIAWMFLSGVGVMALDLILVRPSWLAHFIAASFCFCYGTVILFFYGFHPRSDFLGRGKIARQGSEHTRRNGQRIMRCLVIGFACFLSYFVVTRILNDWMRFIQQGRPYLVEFKGSVDGNDMFFGTFFINQNLDIKKEDERFGHHYFAIFFPRVARYGSTCWFLTAPKSELILDWQPANESTNRPAWE